MAGIDQRRALRSKYYQMMVSPKIGGAAKLAMQIHQHVQATQGRVSGLLLPGGGEAELAANEQGFPYATYSLERLMSPSVISSASENLRLLRRTALRNKTLVHVHAPFVYASAGLYFRLSGAASVVHIHLDFSSEELRWAMKRPPNLILICAKYMASAVENALPDDTKRTRISVVPNAVDLQRYYPASRAKAKAKLELDADRPLLLMAANLSPHKGQMTAVRTVKSLKTMGHDVTLWLVGEERGEGGNFRRALEDLCAMLGVEDRVRLLGFRNDVPDLLRAADFLLLPSTSEGLPLVILEAQASKAVVLAAPTAGVPEIITDNQTGYLVPADDHEGYAQHISRLIGDEQRKNAIADQALHQVRSYNSLSRYCERVISEYSSVLND